MHTCMHEPKVLSNVYFFSARNCILIVYVYMYIYIILKHIRNMGNAIYPLNCFLVIVGLRSYGDPLQLMLVYEDKWSSTTSQLWSSYETQFSIWRLPPLQLMLVNEDKRARTTSHCGHLMRHISGSYFNLEILYEILSILIFW